MYLKVITDFEEAIAMKVNVNKSEAVLLGEWRNNPPANIPYSVCNKVTYLGCTVGNYQG
jgi:hypothetical protein